MPRHVWPLWLLTLALPVLFPPLSYVYWDSVYRAGLLPPDGDSIAIPIFNSLYLSVFGITPFLLFTWFCLRRYNPEARLLTLRWDRPVRTVAATLVFGGLAALLVASIVMTLAEFLPWYEYLVMGYTLLCVAWLLAVRAAVIDQL